MKLKLKLNNNRLKKKDKKEKVEEYKPDWLKNIETVTKNLNKDKKVFKEEDRNIVVSRSIDMDFSSRNKYSRNNIFDDE